MQSVNATDSMHLQAPSCCCGRWCCSRRAAWAQPPRRGILDRRWALCMWPASPARCACCRVRGRAAISPDSDTCLLCIAVVVPLISIRTCCCRLCLHPMTSFTVDILYRCRVQPQCCSWRPGSAAPWRRRSAPWGSARSARHALCLLPWTVMSVYNAAYIMDWHALHAPELEEFCRGDAPAPS